ncbi:MAG: rod shape-determining protein MreC [Gammaproteobacteria bacterium RIFOXYA12_FULL_61_12]|nr:MAG: rod shape-determining protein MreC [Gammaproteobacteria bacterium RIFOXYD12_FULL_61_37]OGT92949.1 MAG: rod shape-determining protein MreC [Gammaproteobacteria bacterium RIFOXYA12_FULL_61_12]
MVIVTVLSLVLLNIERRENYLEIVRTGISTLTYPLQFLADLPSRITGYLSESFASQDVMLRELDKMRQENNLLQVRLQKYDSLEMENMRLRSLLGSSYKLSDQILVTELMQVDLDPFRHQIVINKGSQAGVYVGQPALDAHGIMGQVTHVTPWNATVLLVTDSSHTIPVQVNRTGLRTIAVGTGDISSLRLPFLPNNADIQQGDLLVTSGLGGRFPAGYPVAAIDKIERDPGAHFTEATAAPKAFLDRTREVLLVWTASTAAQSATGNPTDTTGKPDAPAPAPEKGGN